MNNTIGKFKKGTKFKNLEITISKLKITNFFLKKISFFSAMTTTINSVDNYL